LIYKDFTGRISYISFAEDSKDGGISNAININKSLFNKKEIDFKWITYDSVSDLKKIIFLRNYIKSFTNSNHLFHFHGLWRTHSRLNNLNDTLYVVSPHGMLMPHCLKRSRLKKLISRKLWEDNFIKNSKYIFALSIQEAVSISKIYTEKNIILFPNYVNIPNISNKVINLSPPWKNDIGNSKKVLLFLSRFDSIKGIYILIDAWMQLIKSNRNKDWSLAFVGYGDNGNLKNYIEILKNNNNLRDVFVYPPAYGLMKEACFRNSDAFILPSFSEASPMAALEALSYGKPSIISKSCGVYETARFINKKSNYLSQKPYIECLPKTESIKKSLNILFNMNQKSLMELSLKSVSFIEENYNASKKFEDLLNIYSDIAKNKNIMKKFLYKKN